MAKTKTVHVCSECGGKSPRWQGQCPHCQAWNTLIESIVEPEAPPVAKRFNALAGETGRLQTLADISPRESPRVPTGIDEFDRVLGGGLVPGGVVLIGGDPGIGKSTLLLQALSLLSGTLKALYVSGEESAEQVALRASRLQLDARSLQLLPEINLERILGTLRAERPDVAVIDSIQTVYSESLGSAPGSVAQVRECAAQLTRFAKQSGTTLILVGHVTKDGTLAGPRVLEHIVDTVLYFEGDTHSSFRLVRAFKNRFGAVNELGVFAMTDKGLKGVSNPSAIFLSQHGQQQVPGSCVLVTQEGTRPLLVEIQALVDTAHSPSPRRLSVGLEQNRLAMLLAVLHRHAGVVCFDQDVFVNAVGGVKIAEPAADLAVLLAIVSSLTNRPLPRELVVFGEVGLAGEIRPAPRGQERLKESAKLGFTVALVPKANAPKHEIPGMRVVAVDRIEEALERMRELALA
ncbi:MULTISPECIES: DNA repair protein RadA [Zoogloea]|jgi:DNA repair protein RadA/Sms|uniref:DNA repair protein RadA n=1 Tax=Zoogloea oleivorans TaxID=1552750 RepID=A0A6C2CLX7_9RHOO|nr:MULTISPECIES: DNA repair protein RadA [Zoogloea]MBT9496848.1 DNA repair protein RadA [Zoogloea sp.]MDD2669319.1 DNA repair protein RadA [Zoogloea sp.]MDY0034581.1 DNA repair protein RadA [Zoogloea oleivorans]TYC54342.1 DNA repair protein RadA [Zoogloea oleivorans]